MGSGAQSTCDVTSSWKPEDGKSIDSVIVYRQENEDGKNETNSPEHTGLFLTPLVMDAERIPCDISIRVSGTSGVSRDLSYISAVDLLCSARRIEVFTDKSGYVASEEGFRVDEELGMDGKLFMLQHSFTQPVTSCNIKILQHIDDNKLLLHSLHITVKQASAGIPTLQMPAPLGMSTTGSIDLGKVKAMLSDMGGNISERGQGLLNTMEIFQKNKAASMPASDGGGFGPMAAMMAMFAGMRTTSHGGASSELSTFASSSSSRSSAAPAAASASNAMQESPTAGSKSETSQEAPEAKDAMGNSRSSASSMKPCGSSLPHTITNCSINANSLSGTTLTPATVGILSHLELRLQKRLEDAEQRLQSDFTSQLEAAEARIHDKLDRILDQLSWLNEDNHSKQNPENQQNMPQTGEG